MFYNFSAGSLPDDISLDEFYAGISVPKNKELMRIYSDLGMVEQLGSGVPRILEHYGKDCFVFTDNFTKMIFPKSIGGQIGGQIKLTKRQKEVYDLIRNTPNITRKILSEKLKINESAVQKHLNSLRDKKLVDRIGGTRGYWKTNN